jgi:hypothetical protein
MSTRAPVVCTTDWTLVLSGPFSGALQLSGGAVLSVSIGPPASLVGMSSQDFPNPINIDTGEQLYCRALSSDVIVTATDGYGISGGGGSGPASVVGFKPWSIVYTEDLGVGTQYIAKQLDSGAWVVIKNDYTSTDSSFVYATVINNPTVLSINAAWSARASLTYTLPAQAI